MEGLHRQKRVGHSGCAGQAFSVITPVLQQKGEDDKTAEITEAKW